MAIHFFCVCGKHLKAQRDMAGRITLCPACGEHVKIPPPEATRRSVPRFMKAERAPAAGSDPGPRLPEVHFRGERRPALVSHREQPETGWYGTLVYTLPALPWLLFLAAGLAITSALLLDGWADFLRPGFRQRLHLEVFIPCALAIPALLVCATALMSGVLALATEGSLKVIFRPSFDELLRASAQWLVCLAAGPALFLGSAALYWIHCGDPHAVDWMIVTELLGLGSGVLLAALLATCPPGGFRRLHPAGLLLPVRLMGWWFFGASLFFSSGLLAFCSFVGFAAGRLHAARLAGALWLGPGWFVALSTAAFFFRRLGLRYYRASRVHAAADGTTVPTCVSHRLSL